jgi:hypothetical protein
LSQADGKILPEVACVFGPSISTLADFQLQEDSYLNISFFEGNYFLGKTGLTAVTIGDITVPRQ